MHRVVVPGAKLARQKGLWLVTGKGMANFWAQVWPPAETSPTIVNGNRRTGTVIDIEKYGREREREKKR